MNSFEKYEKFIAYKTASDIVNIIQDVYFGTSQEAINFRVNYGSNGAVDKIIETIAEKYIRQNQAVNYL